MRIMWQNSLLPLLPWVYILPLACKTSKTSKSANFYIKHNRHQKRGDFYCRVTVNALFVYFAFVCKKLRNVKVIFCGNLNILIKHSWFGAELQYCSLVCVCFPLRGTGEKPKHGRGVTGNQFINSAAFVCVCVCVHPMARRLQGKILI